MTVSLVGDRWWREMERRVLEGDWEPHDTEGDA